MNSQANQMFVLLYEMQGFKNGLKIDRTIPFNSGHGQQYFSIVIES